MAEFGHRIRSVTADPAAKTVTLTWDDGSSSVKALAPLIARRRAFHALAESDLFATVRVINDGRGIAWGEEVDMCADSLWLDAVGSRHDAA